MTQWDLMLLSGVNLDYKASPQLPLNEQCQMERLQYLEGFKKAENQDNTEESSSILISPQIQKVNIIGVYNINQAYFYDPNTNSHGLTNDFMVA